ncbi:MAG: magnesium transporter [Myxococcota bacterium]
MSDVQQTADATTEEAPDLEEVRDAWPALSLDERIEALSLLPPDDAEDLFVTLTAHEQVQMLQTLQPAQRRAWLRLLDPEDAVDVVQELPADERDAALAALDARTRREVGVLLAYAEDQAGGLMSPRYATVRGDLTIDEAISYLRRQARDNLATVYYAYVLDDGQHLIGVVSLGDLFTAQHAARVRDVMQTEMVTVAEDMDQEQVSRLFSQHQLLAIPVVDKDNRLKGIVTVDDIVDVFQEEATEDIQKLGGTEALDEPYLTIKLWPLLRKRGVWLAVLFLGEMLTATTLGYFEHEMAKAVVLSMFMPLIISSGGNSGSQATTLVIRAMALGEVGMAQWWRVMRREIAAGLVLGGMLGAIGFARIVVWGSIANAYGPYHVLIACVVAISLVSVVLFGTLAGSMLPLLLKRAGLDPASASAPMVATLVDVSGLAIYFSAAALILRGTLL